MFIQTHPLFNFNFWYFTLLLSSFLINSLKKKEGVSIQEINSKTKVNIKHILSSEWIQAKYISTKDNQINLLVENIDNTYFEKDDKVVYSINTGKQRSVYTTVVNDIDFPTYDKISIFIEKPLERRSYSRFNVSISAYYQIDNDSHDCTVVDISKAGFKITTNDNLNIKDIVTINIMIENGVDISCKCSVMYKEFNTNYSNNYEYMVGLKILSISAQDKSLFNSLIDNISK